MAEYYKHEIAKWNVATDDLTLEQEAAYHRVVSQIRLYERPFRENYRVLSGLWRCNERRAKRLLQELVEAGKLSIIDGFIIDEKAVNDASMLRQSRVDKQLAGRLGGIESGKSRRNSTENKETDEAPASTREEKRREEKRDTSSLQSEVSQAAAAVTREAENSADGLHAEVMAAVGLNGSRIPTHWMPPAATIHVQRWVDDLGLTPAQIIDAARESRKRHDEPPNGPRALDGVMRSLAAAIHAKPLTPAPAPPDRQAQPPPQPRNPTAAEISAMIDEARRKQEQEDQTRAAH